MKNRSFRNIRAKYVPYITTMPPKYDLYDQCRENSLAIYRSINVDSEAKRLKMKAALQHLAAADKQRQYYKTWCATQSKFLGSAVL